MMYSNETDLFTKAVHCVKEAQSNRSFLSGDKFRYSHPKLSKPTLVEIFIHSGNYDQKLGVNGVFEVIANRKRKSVKYTEGGLNPEEPAKDIVNMIHEILEIA